MATRVSQALPRDLRYERTPKRVRAVLAGETLADSTAALLVWEPRRAVPAYAFPEADVRGDLLRASENPVPDAHGGGAAFLTAGAGDTVAENAAWRYADPDLAGHVAFSWEAMDQWYEEDEEVFGHPRDPWHRVDARRSARHVRVEIGGETVADSRRPMIVFETGLPTRYYLPRSDVAMERLEATEHADDLRLQGLRVVLVGGRGARRRVDVRGALPRRSADRRPRLLPQRADRHDGRRRPRGAPLDAVVVGHPLGAPRRRQRRAAGPARGLGHLSRRRRAPTV